MEQATERRQQQRREYTADLGLARRGSEKRARDVEDEREDLDREGLELGLGDDRDRVGTWFPKKGVG